jgi:hypothetical protein
MKIKVMAKVELKDKNGKVTKTLTKECKSYVRQLIDILHNCMAYDNTANIKDTGAVSRAIGCGLGGTNGAIDDVLCVNSAAGDSTCGIQVGTGVIAVTISDYYLPSLITHGDTATHLNYGALSVGSVAIVGSTAKFTIARTFTNNSGADIDVKEVALITKSAAPGDSFKFMLEHTLLNFTIANGTSGTVTYTISVTV